MDYRDFEKSNAKESVIPDISIPWWETKGEIERGQKFIGVAKAVREDQRDRAMQNVLHARLYANFDSGMIGTAAFIRPAYTGGPSTRVSMNVVQSAIDTLCSKVAKNKPRPSFQTDGAGWTMQQRARKLDRWTRGVFYETGVYKKARSVFKAACVFGTGAVKIYAEKKGKKTKFCFEPVFIDDIFVDEADGLYGSPCQIFERRLVSKHMLLKEYGDGDKGEKTLAILGAKPSEDIVTTAKANDLVEVWEGWKLNGRHTICLAGGTELWGEDWDKDYFPFVFFKYNERLLGFWGQGLAEQLVGVQQELNRLIRSVSEQLRRKGRGRIFVEHGSKVSDTHISNRIAEIIRYTGKAPIVDSQNAVAREEFDQIRELRTSAFQIAGISELSAAAKKPSGLDAAVALREFSDIESDRFANLILDWEEFFLEVARRFICLARDLGDYSVRVPNRRFVEKQSFKEIALEEDQYVIQMFPVSSLPQTPGARYQKVKEMRADGFISDAVAKRLLEFPDIEAETDLGNAALDDVDATISAILDADTPKLMPPEKYQNLEMLIERATASYLFAKHHGCPKDRLEMLRQLIDRAAALALPAQPQPPPGPPPAPGAPTPGGAPAPMSVGPQMGNLNVQVGPGAPPPAPAIPPLVG